VQPCSAPVASGKTQLRIGHKGSVASGKVYYAIIRVFFIGGFRQIWRKNCYSEKMLGGKIVTCVDFRQTVTEK
jgi:hypothetical protein